MTSQLRLCWSITNSAARQRCGTTKSTGSIFNGTKKFHNSRSNNNNNTSSSSMTKKWFSTQVATDYHENESFLSGTNGVYAEQMYEMYLIDPNSVHKSWRLYFDNITQGKPYREADFSAPTIASSTSLLKKQQQQLELSTSTSSGVLAPSDSLGIAHLIRAYQVNGHTAAQLDPLGFYSPQAFPQRPCNTMDLSKTENNFPPDLTVEYHGFRPSDLDRKLNFTGTSSGGAKGYLDELSNRPEKVTLRAVLNELRKTYTGTLGVEYMHIGNVDKCNWIRERVEHPKWLSYDKEKKQHIFERLCFADTFENFLAAKFNTTKRFGLDGGESIVPALKDAIDRASELGATQFVIGMPHRGRLNVLANVMRKPMPLIFSEFLGTHYEIADHDKYKDPDKHWGMSGDVKCTYIRGNLVLNPCYIMSQLH
jgi:2-oxoglutarate dehydrogenase E1 component